MVFRYLMHGVELSLPFRCEDLGESTTDGEADLDVIAGEVPRLLDAAVLHRPECDVAPATMLFRGGRRSARFLIENGRRITFQKNMRCDERLFAHHLLFPVLTGALWQRGRCVLHASAVLSPQGAVVVTGASGAGKSTTVARLLAEGWPLQADDVCAVDCDGTGRLVVHPGGRSILLDEQSATRLGFATRGLERRDWQRSKMNVPAELVAARQSAPIARIVVLRQAEELSVQTVRGRDKIGLLLQAISGPVLPDVIAKLEALLGQVLREIEMIAIGRPTGRWTLDDVAGAICHG